MWTKIYALNNFWTCQICVSKKLTIQNWLYFQNICNIHLFLARIPIAPADRTVLFAKCFYPNIGLASVLHPAHAQHAQHTQPITLHWSLSGFREKLWYDHYTCRRVNTLDWFSFLHNIDQEVTVGKFISTPEQLRLINKSICHPVPVELCNPNVSKVPLTCDDDVRLLSTKGYLKNLLTNWNYLSWVNRRFTDRMCREIGGTL